MLEVGFQAPPDPTAVPFAARPEMPVAPGLLAEQVPPQRESGPGTVGWIPLFPTRPGPRYLDPCYATPHAPGRLVAEARDDELVVLVARGVVEVSDGSPRRLGALGALRLDPGTAVELHVLEEPALLLGVRARAGGDP
jgi:hypothetical protein